MSECHVLLHCDVSDGEYQRDISLTKANLEERLLSLSGIVSHSGFVENMPFDFRFIDSPEDITDLNQLEINDSIPDYEIPSHLSTLIKLSEVQFNDLRECLLRQASNQDMSLKVTLHVEGLHKASTEKHTLKPTEGKPLTVTGVAWSLSTKHQLTN